MSKFTEEQKEIIQEGIKKVKSDSEWDIRYTGDEEKKEKSIRKVHECEKLEEIIKKEK